MLSVQALIEDAKQLSEDAFADRYGSAFLLLADPEQSDDSSEAGKRTGALVRVGDIVLDLSTQEELVVAPLRPSAEAGLVSVGRDPSNDVVIKAGTVSHRHALFRRQGTTWTVRDVGSKAGTRVGYEPIPYGGEAVPVHVGAHVAFGSVACNFLDARHLQLYLQSPAVA